MSEIATNTPIETLIEDEPTGRTRGRRPGERWPDIIRDDARKLIMEKGLALNDTQKVLKKKYTEVPCRATLRDWLTAFRAAAEMPRDKQREITDYVEYALGLNEDCADDILEHLIPELQERLEEGVELKKMHIRDLLEHSRKYINDKGRRLETKLSRLAPNPEGTTPLQIFIQNAQLKKREQDGSAADETIIDVEVVEG